MGGLEARVSLRVMLPHAAAALVEVAPTATARDVVLQIIPGLKRTAAAGKNVSNINASAAPSAKLPKLVLAPSRLTSGRIIGDDDSAGDVATELRADWIRQQQVEGDAAAAAGASQLELWSDPRTTRVALFDGSKELRELRMVPLDWGAKFKDAVPLLQRLYPHHPFGSGGNTKGAAREPFVVRLFTPVVRRQGGDAAVLKERSSDAAVTLSVTGSERISESKYFMRWLSFHRTLLGQNVPSDAIVVIVPFSLWEKKSMPPEDPEFAGLLVRQSQNLSKSKKISAKEKRYCILTSSFLYCYKKKGDERQPGAEETIPLDHFSLMRVAPAVAVGTMPIQASADPAGSHVELPRCLLLQRAVHLFDCKERSDTYILNVDPPGNIRAMADFYRYLRRVTAPGSAVFGIPLAISMRRPPPGTIGPAADQPAALHIPAVVRSIINHLRTPSALQTEGLFRVSGEHSAVDRWRDAWDNVGEAHLTPNTGEIDMSHCDVHVAATLLKLFLRELPEPLLTAALYRDLIFMGQALENEADSTVRAKAEDEIISHINARLPLPNRMLLLFILEFLADVINASEVNKMHASNMATVMGPNLLFVPQNSSTKSNASSNVSLADTVAAANIASVLFVDEKWRGISATGWKPDAKLTLLVPENDLQRRARARQKVQEIRRQEHMGFQSVGNDVPAVPVRARMISADDTSGNTLGEVTTTPAASRPPPVARDSSYHAMRKRFNTTIASTTVPNLSEQRTEDGAATANVASAVVDRPKDKNDSAADKRMSGPVAAMSAVSLTLTKEGVLRKAVASRSSWLTRYFRCDGEVLQYFKNRRDASPRGEVPLACVAMVKRDTVSGTSLYLTVADETLLIQAHTSIERDSWVRMLERCIANNKGAAIDPTVLSNWNDDQRTGDEDEEWIGLQDMAGDTRSHDIDATSDADEKLTSRVVSETAADVSRAVRFAPRESLPPHVVAKIPGLAEIEVDACGNPHIAQVRQVVVPPSSSSAERIFELEKTVEKLAASLQQALVRIDVLEARLPR